MEAILSLMEKVMFKKRKIDAFQLFEAVFALTILSILFILTALPTTGLMYLQLSDGEILYRIVRNEQAHALFHQERVRINLMRTHVVVESQTERYEMRLQKGCESNFEQQTLILTEDGTWNRGGSIHCGEQSIIIGIGHSTPQLQKKR